MKRKKTAAPRKKTSVYPDLQAEAVKGLYRLATECRMCKSPRLELYLDLGFTAPADQFRAVHELHIPEIQYPLRVVVCIDCGLSQLSHVVHPSILYQYDYPYEQSTTKTGNWHWNLFSEHVIKNLSLSQGDLVVDVGSNVGTLLQCFKDRGMRVCGIDPAPNIVDIANDYGIPTLCAFFNRDSARVALKKFGKAKVIVGSNVFAHIDDLDEVMKAAKLLLTNDGVFIFESPYFQHLVDNLEYDTIYHEHLSYLSVSPLIPFFKRFGMEVFDIERTDIHGGSMRVYIGTIGKHKVKKIVRDMCAEEKRSKLNDLITLQEFAKRVAQNRKDLMDLIEDLLRKGKKIVGVSAPAKGMTLVNYTGITTRHIPYITEKARLKVGRVAPGGHVGGHIPIVSDEVLVREGADYALLLAWNFSREIVSNLKAYTDKGGKFIVPIPVPKIVGAEHAKSKRI